MHRLQTLDVSVEEILMHLEDFERYCLGKHFMKPEDFTHVNQRLSLGTVLHIGKTHFMDAEDGKHLIWTAPDAREHDLGCIENIDISAECPGFHRIRSLSLGHNQVTKQEIIEVPYLGYVTKVTLNGDVEGIGPDYKTALRNAVLKTQLCGRKTSIFSFMNIFAKPLGRA